MPTTKRRLSLLALLCWILAGLFTIGGYFLHSLVSIVYRSEAVIPLVSLLVPWVLAGLLAVAGQRVQKNFVMHMMRRRSANLQTALLNRLRRGEAAEPYFLYLRPFYADTITIDNPEVSSLPFLPSHYDAPEVSWEVVFSRAVEEFGLLVSLGQSSDALTADRIEVRDDQWARDFVLLASFAECIFVWPSARPGTRWEIKWLQSNGLLSKCIFVVPKDYDRIENRSSAVQETWPSVRAFLMSVGMSPPVDTGVMFTVQPHSVVARMLPTRRARLRQALDELISVARDREDVATRRRLWKTSTQPVGDHSPEKEPQSLELLSPCAICGQPLSSIVCPDCERQPASATVQTREEYKSPAESVAGLEVRRARALKVAAWVFYVLSAVFVASFVAWWPPPPPGELMVIGGNEPETDVRLEEELSRQVAVQRETAIFTAILFGLAAILTLVAGLGVRRGRPWGVRYAFLLGCLVLFVRFPVGAVLGALILICLALARKRIPAASPKLQPSLQGTGSTTP